MKKLVFHLFFFFFVSFSAYSQAVCPQAATSNYWREVVSSNTNHAAIKTDGTLWVWGSNTFNQVTNIGSSATIYDVPVQVGTSNDWAQVSVGYHCVYAIKTNGSLWVWGNNDKGRLGTGNTNAISVPTQLQPGTIWKWINAGHEHVVGIKSDGSLWSWGGNTYGQLGTGNTTNSFVPVRIGTGTNWNTVSAGLMHNLAIQTNGTLWAWGSNSGYQIGDGTALNRFSPVQIGTATNWKKVVAKSYVSVGVRTDGSLWGWGSTGFYYGAGNSSNSVPLRINPNQYWLDVYHGSNVMIALERSGVSYMAGQSFQFQNLKTDQFRYDTLTPLSVRFKSYSLSSFAVLGIDSTGSVFGWGGLRGSNDSTVTRVVTRLTTASRELSVCKGSALTVGAVPSGLTGVTYAWTAFPAGTTSALAQPSFTFNRPGMLVVSAAKTGCATTYDTAYVHLRAAPETVTIKKWKEVHSGPNFTIAITNDGEMWGWGSNSYSYQGGGISGILGHRNYQHDTVPIRMHPSIRWRTAITDRLNYFAYGLAEDGTLYNWNGSTLTPLSSMKFKAVSTKGGHILYLDENGDLWSSGQNNNGQCGNGTISTSAPFSRVIIGNKKFVSIAAGEVSSMAVAQDGTLWGWGYNGNGELGIGNTINQLRPVRVGTATDWAQVAYSIVGQDIKYGAHLGLKANGAVWHWGKYMVSGTGTYANYLNPILVSASANLDKILPGGTGISNSLQIYVFQQMWGSFYDSGVRGLFFSSNYDGYFVGSNQTDNFIDVYGRLYSSGNPNYVGIPPSLQNTNGSDQVLNFGGGIEVCVNGTVQFGLGIPQPNRTYSWSTLPITSTTTGFPMTFSFPSTRSVILQVTDPSTGCTFIDSNRVTTFQSSTHAGTDFTQCEGYYQELGKSYVLNHSYQWSSIPVGFTSSKNKIIIFIPEGVTKMVVKDSLNSGCVAYDTVTVNSRPRPTNNAVYPYWNSVSSGSNFSHGIRNDGTLWAWGGNAGTLGDGTTTNRSAPVQIGTSRNWKTIKAGALFTIGLQTDGSLWSWGNGNNGVLGRGAVTSSTAPVRIGTGTWKTFSCGFQFVMAIASDGSLWGWGYNSTGQLGIGNTTTQNTPVRIGTANDWREVAAGENFTVAVKNDGTLWTWGSNANKQLANANIPVLSNVPIQVGTDKDWVKVAAGWETGFAFKMDTTLWAWGLDGSEGMTGTGAVSSTPFQINVPTQIPGKWLSVNCSGFGRFTHGIKTDYSLWAWGSNQNSMFGDPQLPSSKIPLLIPTRKAYSISNSYGHVLLIDSNASILSWGQNGFGQLGVGTTVDHYFPKQINQWGFEIEICSGTTLNLGSPAISGITYSWPNSGTNTTTSTRVVTPATSAYSQEYYTLESYNGICGASSSVKVNIKGKQTPTSATICEGNSIILQAAPSVNYQYPNPKNCIKDWKSNPIEIIGFDEQISGISYHTSRVRVYPKGTTRYYFTDSTLYPFGCILKDSCLITITPKPEAVATVYWKKVVSGNGFSIGIKSDGSIFAWGGNASGQLGLGTTISTATPTRIGTSTNWADVSAGDNHVLAVQKDGSLWAWGNNTSGKLGDGTTVNRLAPVRIGTAVNWKSVSAGLTHSTGIQTNGFLFGWGDNSLGQLGTGNTISVSVPTRVGTATNWISVEAGEKTTVGIRSGFQNWCGSLWVWGEQKVNISGNPSYNVPTQLGTENNWWKISCRGAGKAALKSDGSLYAWGFSFTNVFYTQSTPVLRSAEKWINVVAGQMNLHAQKENRTVWGIGGNAGTLGDGTTNAVSNLVPVSFSGFNIAQLDHNYHFTAVDRNGAFWTISNNASGESGMATFVPSVPNRSAAEKDIKTCNSTFSLGQTAVAGNTYQWTVNYNLISSSAVLSATPQSYLTYYNLRVTNAAGCVQRDTITLEGGKTRINKPSGLVKACYGQNSIITPEYSWGSHRYSWSTNRLATDTANNSSSFSLPNVTNSIAVYLTDSFPAGKCTSRDTVNLSVFKPVVAAKYHYVMVSSINSHGLAIRNDGTLWAWGINSNGQLGDGTTTTRTLPVQIGTAKDWVFVAAGNSTSFGIKADGSLWSWGLNVNGTLGRTGTANVPGQVGVEKNWKSVCAGTSGSLAIKLDGTLWAWGQNLFGSLGLGGLSSATVPTQVGNQKDWEKVSLKAYHALGIKKDSSLWVWGEGINGKLGLGTTSNQTTPIRLGTGNQWKEVASGHNNSFAIKADGTLWGWGLDGGLLGNQGSNSAQLTPIQIGSNSSWKTISASLNSQSFMGIQMDSSLWVWGVNATHPLGTGSTQNVTAPLRIRAEEYWLSAQHSGAESYLVNASKSIFVSGTGYRNSLVHNRVDSTSNDVSFCGGSTVNLGYAAVPLSTYYWQSNPFTVGNPTNSNFGYTPTSPATWWVTATDSNGCVARDTAFVKALNQPINQLGADRSNCRSNTIAIGSAGINGETFSWSSIPAGFTATNALVSVSPLVNTQYIRAVTNSCGTTRDTLLVSINVPNAGADRNVCRGSDAQVPFSKVAKHRYSWTANKGFERIVSNDTLTVKKVESTVQIILDDYDSTAFCIAKDTLNLTVINAPLAVAAYYWVDVATGFAHTLAVRSDGTLWAWGRGTEGQLGDGASANRSQPILVGTATDWEKVYVFNNSSFATKTNGELYAWGNNNQYILGTGDLLGKTTPTLTNSSGGWKKIHCSTHCMAVKNDGTLWGWGQNANRELMNGTNVAVTIPTQIGTWNDLLDVQAGGAFSLALRSDQKIYGAGRNIFNILDSASTNTTTFSLPIQVASSKSWKSLSVRNEAVVAIANDGTLWSWGNNNYGQLGLGNNLSANSPQQIGGSSLWTEVVGDGFSFFGKQSDQSTWAWGFNLQGHLGIGNKLNQNAPAVVDSSYFTYKIVPAGDHTIALSPNGQLFVTGANSSNVFTSTMGATSFDRPAIVPSNGKEIFPCVGTNWTLGRSSQQGDSKWYKHPANCTNCHFSTLPNPTVQVIQKERYSLQVRAINGCVDSKTVTITPKLTPQIALGADRDICGGTSVPLGTTPDTSTTFSWSSVPAGLSSSLSSVTVTPTQTTQYSVVAVNRCGTQNTSVTLTYDPLKTPVVTFQPSPDTVTSDQSIHFFTTAMQQGSTPTWEWYRNGQFIAQGGSNYAFNQWKDYDTIQVVLNSSATCKTKPADTAMRIVRVMNIRNTPGDYLTATICTPIQIGMENMVRDSLQNLVYSVSTPPAGMNQVCWGIRQFGGSTVRKSLWNGGQQLTYWLDRNFFIEPNQQPGAPVTVKFYFDSTELNEIIDSVSQQTGQVFNRDSIRLFKFSTNNLDLDPLNNGNSDSAFQILSPRISLWHINPKFTVLEFQISSFSEFSFGIKANNPNPLPIETLRWKVEKKGNDALIQWTQPQEELLNAYEVQFSTTGMDFQTIHRVSAGQQNYHFLQSNAADLGKTGFYRITEINLDGSRESSSVQRLIWNNPLQFGPNPVHAKGIIASSKSLRSNWELTDAQGRIIRSGTWNGKELEIDFQGLAAGVYFIRTEGEVLKWVKE